MARQIGHYPIQGTIDGLTFYHHPEHGFLVQPKSSLTGERILNDPKFHLFMLSSMDFREAIYAGKLFRKSIHAILFPSADGKLSSRMNTTMLTVVQSDLVNDNGQRKCCLGNMDLLKDFELNSKLPLDQVFNGPFLISRNKSNNDLHISIPHFTVSSAINVPEYVNGFQFVVMRSMVNFESGTYTSIHGESVKVPISQSVCPDLGFTLSLKTLEGSIDFLVLGIVFFAELKKIPRNAISQRKRMKLKHRIEADGTVKFTGTLKVVRVMRN